MFSALFPGGEGRLLLTNPDDMLTTGIEVEARPPGKKIKRLSLLSGGEKSLTAVAMLVAIFRARPSPFYVMDEVEAALDDVNLRRLLGLFEQLRAQSQLIVITHQKPTMEVADALYGVTMRDDGITAVISQRMRGQELVGAPRASIPKVARLRRISVTPRRRSSARSAAPQPCRQISSSSMNRCSQSTTAAGDSIAGASSGRATATASAPIASALAASMPVRMPPEATSGTSGSVLAHLQQRLGGRDTPLGQRRVAHPP